MVELNKERFIQAWPKCFIIFMGVIEVLAAILLVLVEVGNVGADFWMTNVFAGGWCGLLMLAQSIALFVTTCCAPGPAAAFRAVIVAIIALVACATCIAFNAVFLAQTSTCILTSSCASNSASTSIFSYSFESSFWTNFRNLSPFTNYTQQQAKFLFQTVEIGLASLCFILSILFLIIYYVIRNKVLKAVGPGGSTGGGEPSGYGYSNGRGGARGGPRQPQSYPGEVAWNPKQRRY